MGIVYPFSAMECPLNCLRPPPVADGSKGKPLPCALVHLYPRPYKLRSVFTVMGGYEAHLRPRCESFMQIPAYRFPRRPLLGDSVNRGRSLPCERTIPRARAYEE